MKRPPLRRATKVFLALLAFLLLNVGLSLSLTFTVPLGENPFQAYLEHPIQLGLFIATGLIVIALDFYLLFGNIGESELLSPFSPVSVFGFMSPLLFLALYFVQRPTTPGAVSFFQLIPMTFITIMFYLVMTLINAITENVRELAKPPRQRRAERPDVEFDIIDAPD